MSRISLCAKRLRGTPITRSGRRLKTERPPPSAERPPSKQGSRHDSANPQGEEFRSVRARCHHRDRAVFPLPLSRAELLPRTHLPLEASRLPGIEVFLHSVSVHDSLHCLFIPSLGALHFHLEVSSAAKSGQASRLSNHVQSQQSVPRARRGPQPSNAGAIGNTPLA